MLPSFTLAVMEHASPPAILLIFILVFPAILFISRAKRGSRIDVRRIPGINAIEEAIGRSVELGRPISFTSGLTAVSPLLYACLGVLRHIARKVAIFHSRIIVPCGDPESLVLTEATLQSAFRIEKRTANYDPTASRFLSSEQFAFASGYMGTIHRENVGSSFIFGSFHAESLILAEAGQQIGSFQVAATTSPEQIPFFITACDYTLIGEEVYASGAYLSKEPVQTGSLKGQDYGKLAILSLILMGSLEATLDSFGVSFPITSWLTLSWADIF